MSDTAKYTPGPWVVHKRWPCTVVPLADEDKNLGGSVDPDDEAARWSKVIASREGTDFPKFHRSRVMKGEDKANAKLIAAAPEMAEMLLRLHRIHGYEDVGELLKKAGVL